MSVPGRMGAHTGLPRKGVVGRHRSPAIPSPSLATSRKHSRWRGNRRQPSQSGRTANGTPFRPKASGCPPARRAATGSRRPATIAGHRPRIPGLAGIGGRPSRCRRPRTGRKLAGTMASPVASPVAPPAGPQRVRRRRGNPGSSKTWPRRRQCHRHHSRRHGTAARRNQATQTSRKPVVRRSRRCWRGCGPGRLRAVGADDARIELRPVS